MQGQQLMDLEQKLTVAKEELEKTALDKVTDGGGAWDTRQIRYCCIDGMALDRPDMCVVAHVCRERELRVGGGGVGGSCEFL